MLLFSRPTLPLEKKEPRQTPKISFQSNQGLWLIASRYRGMERLYRAKRNFKQRRFLRRRNRKRSISRDHILEQKNASSAESFSGPTVKRRQTAVGDFTFFHLRFRFYCPIWAVIFSVSNWWTSVIFSRTKSHLRNGSGVSNWTISPE